MNPHIPKVTPTWGVGVLKDSQIFRERLQGSNPSVWRIFYITENLLKHRCLKWARITHLDIWNTSYGQKKGRESNWQFDSQPLKVNNRPNFLACRWRATYRWKYLNEDYNFASDFIAIGGMHTISELPLGSPGTKSHLNVGLVERHKIYYKG